MRGTPDAVVIGAGPNGLVAANVLADAGWSVLVLEGQPQPGGGVRSSELIEPGFVNDHCSAFYPLAVASPVIRRLRLEEHGLRWCRAPVVLAHPSEGNGCPVVSMDIDETAASLDQGARGDGDAWRRLYDHWRKVKRPLLRSMFVPMPPMSGPAGLAARLGPRGVARFARFALVPVRRLGEQEFLGGAARQLLAGSALHADLAPEATLSGFFGWLMCSLAQDVGFPVPEGGASAFTDALIRRLEARGGSVVCSREVVEVVVRRGRAEAVRLADGTEVEARLAVLADVDAPTLYRRLLPRHAVTNALLADIDRFEWDHATVKVDWNLDGPIPWRHAGAARAGTIHIAEGVDDLTVYTSELARGLLPARPFLLLGQQSMTDPTRQPRGFETAWAYTHVPRSTVGDAAGELRGVWDRSDAERFADRMERRIERLAPGFRSIIRARHVKTPGWFEGHDPNLRQGAINGGTTQLHQQAIFRPVPGLGRPSTPVRGLFLASASAHPGGGVHGGPGANAARAALLAPTTWARRTTFALGRR